MLTVDIARARVVTPEGSINKARFVFVDGIFAVWTEDRQARTATRVLYGSGATFVKGATARTPNDLYLEDGTVLHITQTPGGGCGCRSPLKGKGANQLVMPEVSNYP